MEALLALLLAAQAPPSLPPDPAAQALAERVEARERGLPGLEADFEQRYRSGALGREIVEKGKLSLKPPDRMLFDYQSPEKKVFVADGERSYFYVPQDHQVFIQSLKGEKGLLSALLTGRESLLVRFAPSLVPGEQRRLRLDPRAADPDVDHVLMEVDESFLIRRVEIWDSQGNRTEFRFEKMRPNGALPDRLFHFDIPKGAERVEG